MRPLNNVIVNGIVGQYTKLGDLETCPQKIFKIRCSEIVFCGGNFDHINLPADIVTIYRGLTAIFFTCLHFIIIN